MDYETRKTERTQRLRDRASRLAVEADAATMAAKSISDRIPFGQPILVGHHSEKRHRRDVERINRASRKAVELRDEATSLIRRADASENDRTISSDDPRALDKLRAKLAEIEARRARMVAANKAVRSKSPRESLAALGFSAELIEKIMTPDFAGRIGFPPYALQNAAAECSRIRKRIEGLVASASEPARESIVVGGAKIEEAENRVRIVFDGRPNDEMVQRLKSRGFRWAPSVGAWQRQATNAARFAARQILEVDREASA